MLAIKDVLIKLQLSLVNCRRQCYDGARNIMGHNSDMAKRIQDLQPKAYPTHCHGHSLSFLSSQGVFSTSSLSLWRITPSLICIILHNHTQPHPIIIVKITALSSTQLKRNRWISGLFIVIKG